MGCLRLRRVPCHGGAARRSKQAPTRSGVGTGSAPPTPHGCPARTDRYKERSLQCPAAFPTSGVRMSAQLRRPRHRQRHRGRDRAHRGRFPGPAPVNKGSMTLIDEPRAEAIYASMGPAIEASGGSAATPSRASPASARAGPSSARSRTMRSARRSATTSARPASLSTTPPATDGPSTARCYVLVTPDGERTMNTYLGAARTSRPPTSTKNRSQPPASSIWRAICGIRRRRRTPSARRPRSRTAPAARSRSRSRIRSASTAIATNSST